MNVLIIGSTGFIGKRLTKFLFNESFNLYGLSKNKNKLLKSKQILFDLICDKSSSLEEILAEINVDVIINAASVLADNNNSKSFQLIYDNLKIIENVINLAKILKPKKIINLSSIAVYPNKSGKYSESSETYVAGNNEALYGLGKICSENLLDYFLSEMMQVINLRLGQVYGEGMRDDRIISIMTQELQKNNSITLWNNGKRVSNFLDVDLLCEYILKFIKAKNVKGIFNVGDKNLSYSKIANNLIKRKGNNNSKIFNVSKGKTSKVFIDLSKLKNEFGQR